MIMNNIIDKLEAIYCDPFQSAGQYAMARPLTSLPLALKGHAVRFNPPSIGLMRSSTTRCPYI